MSKIKITLLAFSILISQKIFSQPHFIGVCDAGGHQFGTIMKYTAGDSVLNDVYKLPGVIGWGPKNTGCTEVNGKLYGMTHTGGAYSQGIIFEYDYNSGSYLKKIDLGGSSGALCEGILSLGNNGKLYSTTLMGGVNQNGVIFEYDVVNNIYTHKFTFYPSNGKNPTGYFVLASNNKLYGMTKRGGANENGVLFEYDYVNNVYAKKADFSIINANTPCGGMIEAPNGKLYGMTTNGGTNGLGVVFEYDFVTNSLVKKIDLDQNNGSNPDASLIIAPNGKMYGVTAKGGLNNGGVLFEYDYVNNLFVKKSDFVTGNPIGKLFSAANGFIYGTTVNRSTFGSIFEYDYNTNSLTDKIVMSMALGVAPMGNLMAASNGLLYGMTNVGGAGMQNSGVLFEYDFINNSYNVKVVFNSSGARRPTAAPVLAANGKFYGLTQYGGLNNAGTIYEYDYVSNQYVNKIDVNTVPMFNDKGGLLHAGNGKLYGTGRGSFSTGRIFEFDYINNTCIIKASFVDSLGRDLNGSMIEASNGLIYGIAEKGGLFDKGVIFEFDPVSNVLTKKFDFDSTSGHTPTGTLIEATNGKLYGLTQYGGINNIGTVFEYDLAGNVYIKKYDFVESTGSRPQGSLIEASNGKLYGMTVWGGDSAVGVIFEYDIVNNIYTKKVDLTIVNGSIPLGTLLEASNGKLYGVTSQGGNYRTGVIFEYDYNSNTYLKYVDLDAPVSGSYPSSALIECLCLPPLVAASGPVSFCQGDNVILSTSASSNSIIQWYRNNIPISGATNDSLLVTIAGKYTVSVSNSLCPTLTSDFIRVTIPCISPFDPAEKITGIDDGYGHFTMNIFYDPATKEINLSAMELKGKNYNIEVFDNAGKLIVVEKGKVSNNEISRKLVFNSFATGMYLIRFNTEMEQNAYKFWK